MKRYLISTEKLREKEKAVLVGVELPGQRNGECRENLDELAQLARTAGLKVGGSLIQERERIHPA